MVADMPVPAWNRRSRRSCRDYSPQDNNPFGLAWCSDFWGSDINWTKNIDLGFGQGVISGRNLFRLNTSSCIKRNFP